jgi:hypothetical protein
MPTTRLCAETSVLAAPVGVPIKARGDGTDRGQTALSVEFRIEGDIVMNGIIYIVGLVVVIAAVLSFFGLR